MRIVPDGRRMVIVVPPFVEVTAIVFLRRIALFLSRTVLKGQFIKERALGQVASQEVEYNDGQDGPAGQDVDRLIRRSEHKEQAAKQEDDTGQAKDTDARRSQFKADTQQADQKGGDNLEICHQRFIAGIEQQTAKDDGRCNAGTDAGHLDFCQEGGNDQGYEQGTYIGDSVKYRSYHHANLYLRKSSGHRRGCKGPRHPTRYQPNRPIRSIL